MTKDNEEVDGFRGGDEMDEDEDEWKTRISVVILNVARAEITGHVPNQAVKANDKSKR